MNRMQIKICGITNVPDARICAELGADMIGLNFYPQSARYIGPEVARRIVRDTPRDIRTVGVFVDVSTDEVREIATTVGLGSVQLHGQISPEVCRELAQEFRVIRALRTDSHFRPEYVASFHDCDLLLDAEHPELHGGTGRRCDWLAARAARVFTRFLILSGGLNTQNVAEAIATVAPHGVDACSGVERAPGLKDHHAIEKFITAVRAAEASTTNRAA
jgi:phosphoribosylanthranilate isomerase